LGKSKKKKKKKKGWLEVMRAPHANLSDKEKEKLVGKEKKRKWAKKREKKRSGPTHLKPAWNEACMIMLVT